MRSGFSPLAELSIECELEQGDIDALVFQIDQAKGVSQLELPYISSAESYLVQEYKITPLLFGKIAQLKLKMVQQRSALVPEDTSLFTVSHVPVYDSAETNNFRNISKQLGGGLQATKTKGTYHIKEKYWDVTFLLSLAEAQDLDQQLSARRGIYPFEWSADQDPQNKRQWICSEWEIEYFAKDLHVFSGQFLQNQAPISTIIAPPLNCDIFYDSVKALLPLNTTAGFTEIKYNLATFGITATINSQELDPFGNPGVAQFNGTQAFRLPSAILDLSGYFSIELWFKPTNMSPPPDPFSGGVSSTFLELRPDSQNSLPFNCYFFPDGKIGVGWVNFIPNSFSAVGKVIPNSWNYLNISRATDFELFLNGESLITIPNVTQNLSSNAADWYIGGFKPSPPYAFSGLIGYMSDLRVSTGIIRNGLIVPTVKFPSVQCVLPE